MTVPPDDLVYGNGEPLTSDRQIIIWLRQERENLMERLEKVEAELAEERARSEVSAVTPPDGGA